VVPKIILTGIDRLGFVPIASFGHSCRLRGVEPRRLKQKTPPPQIFKNSEDTERVQDLAQDYTGSKDGLSAAPSGEYRASDE
jgi:hypothetical protein